MQVAKIKNLPRIEELHGQEHASGIVFLPEGPVQTWQSPFQEIQIFENKNLGTVLLLDGLVMTTDVDAPYYHEMLVHPVMVAHHHPKHVLVIGGGDGGTVTELTRYKTLETITMVEIDQLVVDVCREQFPLLSVGLDDPRVRLLFEDGAAFIKNTKQSFDIIIVDGSDPVGPAKVLFAQEFFRTCKEHLNPGGLFVTQAESPLYYESTIRNMMHILNKTFTWAELYSGLVPTYPGAHWCWAWAGTTEKPAQPKRPTPQGLHLYQNGMFPQLERQPIVVQELSRA